ncbi:unnamed protein product [Arabidopsis lyrata]|nr:unnamed protein product [Arabidopsis lyrata]
MAGSSWVVSQKPSPLRPSTLLTSLGLKLLPEPIFKPPPLSAPKPPPQSPPKPPDPPPGRSCLEALVTISSSRSPPLLHHAALDGISLDRGQICTLFSEQPRLPLPPLPFNLKSEGLVSITLLCIVQWYRTYPLLVLIYLCMRFVPQYEDFTLIRLDQSYIGMVVMSLTGSRHLCRQSLTIVGSGFGVNLLVLGYLSDHFYGESDLPCIEDVVRLVLTFSVAKDGGEVEVLCDKTSQTLQQLIQKIEEYQDTFACLPNAFWMSMSSCYGMGWFMEEPLMASIQHGSSFRPVVSFALVAEELALKTAICTALVVGVSRLAYYSNWQELPLLLNVGGHTFAVDDILDDIRRMKTKLLPFPFFMCLSFGNSSVACIFSSSYGV